MTIGNLGEYDLTQISSLSKKKSGLLKELDKSFEAVLAEVVADPNDENTSDALPPARPPRGGHRKPPTAEDMKKLIEKGSASGALTETEVADATTLQEQIAGLMNSDDFKAIQTAIANKQPLTDDQKALMTKTHALMKAFSEYAHKVLPPPPDMSSVQERMMKRFLREMMKMQASDSTPLVEDSEETEEAEAADVDNTVTAVDDTETTETADTTDTTSTNTSTIAGTSTITDTTISNT